MNFLVITNAFPAAAMDLSTSLRVAGISAAKQLGAKHDCIELLALEARPTTHQTASTTGRGRPGSIKSGRRAFVRP
jgi:hypothetical protein